MSNNKSNNPFKELANKEEAPAKLKQKVMHSIQLAETLKDFAELFTVNMVTTAAKLIDNQAAESKKDGNKSDQQEKPESQ
ncbi:hypothetical protein [uncultured Imperialibacter sp.]|uniref:hypothetical protein n=1 Tax=uncultured Imperialibacter sp. TaxID=1672639 RepID=UPI0030D9C9C8|tara:strand:+ start:7991 stop:8230 length:240 start_codon:yes stop_codon:yes gene_type:complete